MSGRDQLQYRDRRRRRHTSCGLMSGRDQLQCPITSRLDRRGCGLMSGRDQLQSICFLISASKVAD